MLVLQETSEKSNDIAVTAVGGGVLSLISSASVPMVDAKTYQEMPTTPMLPQSQPQQLALSTTVSPQAALVVRPSQGPTPSQGPETAPAATLQDFSASIAQSIAHTEA